MRTLLRVPRLRHDVAWSNKYEPHGSACDAVGVALAADQQKSLASISHGEVHRIAAIRRNRAHCDLEDLSHGLLQILQPQVGSNLGRTKLETQLHSASVNLCERRTPFAKPELRHGNYYKVRLDLGVAPGKSRPAQYLVGGIADVYMCGFERRTHRVYTIESAKCDVFPDWKIRDVSHPTRQLARSLALRPSAGDTTDCAYGNCDSEPSHDSVGRATSRPVERKPNVDTARS